MGFASLEINVHKVLCLPRNLHFKVHKVVHLPRNLHFKAHKVLHLPGNLHFKVHKDCAWYETRTQNHVQSTAPATKSAHRRQTAPISCACHEKCSLSPKMRAAPQRDRTFVKHRPGASVSRDAQRNCTWKSQNGTFSASLRMIAPALLHLP